MGPFPESQEGNKFILVITKYLTRWVETAAIPDAKAMTIASKLLDKIIFPHGCPLQILSDRAPTPRFYTIRNPTIIHVTLPSADEWIDGAPQSNLQTTNLGLHRSVALNLGPDLALRYACLQHNCASLHPRTPRISFPGAQRGRQRRLIGRSASVCDFATFGSDAECGHSCCSRNVWGVPWLSRSGNARLTRNCAFWTSMSMGVAAGIVFV